MQASLQPSNDRNCSNGLGSGLLARPWMAECFFLRRRRERRMATKVHPLQRSCRSFTSVTLTDEARMCLSDYCGCTFTSPRVANWLGTMSKFGSKHRSPSFATALAPCGVLTSAHGARHSDSISVGAPQAMRSLTFRSSFEASPVVARRLRQWRVAIPDLLLRYPTYFAGSSNRSSARFDAW